MNVDVLSLQNSTSRVINESGAGNRGNIQLATSVSTNWHFIALTDTGGAAPTVQLYEFTEVQAGQVSATPYLPTGRTAIPAMTTHLGALPMDTVATRPRRYRLGFRLRRCDVAGQSRRARCLRASVAGPSGDRDVSEAPDSTRTS